MSKADKMFEDIGLSRRLQEYQKSLITIKYYGTNERYEYDNFPRIVFYNEDKELRTSSVINMDMLKAINEKCKELGWF